jgi:WD40 repeat protein
MTRTECCPACGRRLPEDARPGLCPACLLTVALGGAGSTDEHIGRTAEVDLDPSSEGLGHFGDYELLGVIARGGMGVVYRGWQKSLKRDVALKMMFDGRFATVDDVRRFRLEAEIVATLDHPNIVPIYEVGQHQGRHYFSMRLIGGGSLAQRVDAFRADPRGAALLVAKVARAVQFAHRRALLHRDLKPANILIDEWGEPQVTDFGLAKRMAVSSGLTHLGPVMGTPSYMAPEQATGRPEAVTTAVDIYGLGAILYELLTGRPPFGAETVLETLRQVQEREPIWPDAFNPRVDADLQSITLKCLAKEPGRRYASAEAVAADIDRWLAGVPIEARPVTTWGRVRKWARRRPATAALFASIVAVTALGLAGIIWQWRRAEVALNASIEGSRRESRLRMEAARLAANLSFDDGQTLLAQGSPARGLLWSARALGLAPAAEEHLQWLLRVNLADQIRRLRPLERILPHTAPVRCVAFSPDGRVVLTAGDDQAARQWEAATGKPVGEPMLHRGRVTSARFSPDGRLVLTSGFDSAARLWEAATGKPVGEPMVHAVQVIASRFSPDGRLVLTSGFDGEARMWEAGTGKPVGRPMLHDGGVVAARFSPDGRLVLTAGADGAARMWDAGTGKPVGQPMPHRRGVVDVLAFPGASGVLTVCEDGVVRRWDASGVRGQELLTHPGGIKRSAVSPDGRVILTVGTDRQTRLWDAANGQPIGQPIANGVGSRLTEFAPDGRSLLMDVTDKAVGLWDTATGRPTGGPIEHQGRVFSAAIAPAAGWIVTGASDNAARLWGVQPVEADDLTMLDHGGAVIGLALSPDGRRALTGGEGGAQLWDAATGKPVSGAMRADGGFVGIVAFSPDGRLALTVGGIDGAIRLWDAATGKAVDFPLRPRGRVTAAAFSPDGRTILTGSIEQAGRIQFWDVASGREMGPPLSVSNQVLIIAVSPDGAAFLAACGDGLVRVWRTSTRETFCEPLAENERVKGAPYAAVFSPDSRTVLTALGSDTARLWDASTGKPLGKPMRHFDTISHAVFDARGRLVLTGGFDGAARLWDAASGLPVGVPFDHQAPIHVVAFDPAGRLVLTAGFDGAARLWDAATGRPVGSPRWHRGPVVAAFSPDGRSLLTGSADRTAQIWRIPTPSDADSGELIATAQALTGMELDADGVARTLDPETWQKRRQANGPLGTHYSAQR